MNKSKLITTIVITVMTLSLIVSMIYCDATHYVDGLISRPSSFSDFWDKIDGEVAVSALIRSLLFFSPQISYVCGKWFDNLPKTIKITHGVFMGLSYYGIFLVILDLSLRSFDIYYFEEIYFFQILTLFLLLCVYTPIVILMRIAMWAAFFPHRERQDNDMKDL